MSFMTQQEVIRSMYLITSNQTRNKAIPDFAQMTFFQTYQNIDISNMVLYQGKLEYDIQLQLTSEIISYNTDKSEETKALILPTQIYGKWPKIYLVSHNLK